MCWCDVLRQYYMVLSYLLLEHCDVILLVEATLPGIRIRVRVRVEISARLQSSTGRITEG